MAKMSKATKLFLFLFALLVFTVLLVFFYARFAQRSYLTFSDGAKFAVIARNLIHGQGFNSDFSFYSQSLLTRTSDMFSASGIPYLVPLTISAFFRLFGVSDFSVLLFSETFFVLLVLVTFLLARKLYGNLVGMVSAIAVAASQNLLNYGTSGASEVLYSFLVVAAVYLVCLNKKWVDFVFFVSLILIYLTKPQGIVFIGALLLLWFLMRFSWKMGLTYFGILIFGILMIDKIVLYPLSFKLPVYPIVTRGVQALMQYSPTTAVSDALRGQPPDVVGLSQIAKKTFYNLYNFYKLLPEIASPYLWGLFVFGLLIKFKKKETNLFRLFVLLGIVGTFLLAALTIPFYRYLHPVIPFVYILASLALVWMVRKLFSNRKIVIFASFTLIIFFLVGQTLGVIFLDSRFVRNTHNMTKAPVYVKLSHILRDNTDQNQVIVTNLDTWGSWYGERKTVWFPLEPGQLINSSTGEIPFDGIFLTSYLINDENYYMGDGWREIFDNPQHPERWVCDGCTVIAREFKLGGVYQVQAAEDYERQDATAVLLVKK